MFKTTLLLAGASTLCSMATDPMTLGTASLGGLAPTPDALGGTSAPLGSAPDALGGTPAPDALGGTPPADNPNLFTFKIPNTETNIGIEIDKVPAEVRMDILKKGIRDYVTNSVNQANVRVTKDNAPFDAYDEAMKADALQTAVKKPDGERKVADLIPVAVAARKRLYDGEVRKQGDGTGTTRTLVDPLTKLVTEAVVRELHAKDKAAGGKRKYTEFTAEVATAGGGIKYLEAKIEALVAGGGDRATYDKFMADRYINPAKMMLGQKSGKSTAPENSIL